MSGLNHTNKLFCAFDGSVNNCLVEFPKAGFGEVNEPFRINGVVNVGVKRDFRKEFVPFEDELLPEIEIAFTVGRIYAVNHVHRKSVEFFIEDVVGVVTKSYIGRIEGEGEGLVINRGEVGCKVVHAVSRNTVLVALGCITIHVVKELGEAHNGLFDYHTCISCLLSVC